MTACPTLLTERLILRPFEESDVDAYTELLTTAEVRHSLRLPETVSRREAWLGMAQWRGQWELRATGQFAVEERASGRFVGRAGLHRPEQDDWPGVEVGWALHPDAWGRGYATEAGAASLAYAFDVMGLDRGVQRHPPRQPALAGGGRAGWASPWWRSGCSRTTRRSPTACGGSAVGSGERRR